MAQSTSKVALALVREGRSEAVRFVGKERAGRQSGDFAGEAGDALVVVEARQAQAPGARSPSEMPQGGFQSSGAHSRAGMTKISTCVLHVTDRQGR